MSIFTYYPKIAYKIDDHNYLRAIDINLVAKIKDYISNYRGIAYAPYIVGDGESPDFISYKEVSGLYSPSYFSLRNPMYHPAVLNPFPNSIVNDSEEDNIV
jgi:hypothetical protein